MAAQPAFPKGTEPTGTAWKTRTDALVHKIRDVSQTSGEGWFCTGCLATSRPTFYVTRNAALAQEHANGCTGVQV